MSAKVGVSASKTRVALSLSGVLLLGACEFAPDYRAPVVSLPSQFTDAGGASGGALAPSGAWWTSFGDSQLNAQEGQVDVANPDLAAALAAYQASHARADAAVSGIFPEIDVEGGVSANKQSANRPLRSATQPTFYGANQIYGGVANYELDVWGRVADIVKAAKANTQAAGDALADARLSLHGQLARDYLDLRALDAETKLLADTIKLYRSALDLTRQRLDAKIAPPIDAQRAETQVENVRAQASDLALRRTALVDAIATLTGEAAAGYRVSVASAPTAFPRRPRAVPGDVLRRRPDVALAERDFAAATALIGAAHANMYPKFTISLMGGTQDTSIRLLDPANTFYSIGPSLSVPLFDFGLREAELKQAEAQARIAADRYRSTVLQAVREVQDDLSALRWLAAEASQTEAAARAAGKALDMSMALYRDGAASYLDVVTAQDSVLQTQRAAIGVRAREFDAYVGLIMALGGGWSVPYPEREPSLANAGPG